MSRAPKSDEERGPIGAWARRERMRLGLPNTEAAVERIQKVTGRRVRADYLRGIESGTNRPGADTLHALETTYRSKAPRPRIEDDARVASAVAAAMAAQAGGERVWRTIAVGAITAIISGIVSGAFVWWVSYTVVEVPRAEREASTVVMNYIDQLDDAIDTCGAVKEWHSKDEALRAASEHGKQARRIVMTDPTGALAKVRDGFETLRDCPVADIVEAPALD